MPRDACTVGSLSWRCVAGRRSRRAAGYNMQIAAFGLHRASASLCYAPTCGRAVPRPILATIDLAALRDNLALARTHARHRFVWAVVKANAYGHGLERAVRAFEAADGLALLDLAEAERARSAGWPKPILLLEGFFEPHDIDTASELGATPVIHCSEQVDMLERARPNRPLDVHFKVNTGMNRLGFANNTAGAAYARVKAMANVRDVTLMMHFANADRAAGVPSAVDVADQVSEFGRITRGWPDKRSLANSAALFLRPEVGGDSVRPGIALYGAATDEAHPAATLGVRPAMTLTSKLIGVQRIKTGDAVGYGSRYLATRDTRIGVVACGYADGYPRHAPDGTPVAVDGVRVPLVGRVSMDMITVDLNQVPRAQVGSAVELWGAQVPVDEVANAAGTVGYELLCALAPRVPVAETH
jgi:alanine racemase